ncbi:MAG TPA: FkbM family methyltransferase, partial [Gemmatimonadaceae bacterium]|nr:FkbM family methyltransferase [Gemmatimonadaceae bacterium]
IAIENGSRSIAIHQWFRDRGDETLRLAYPLDAASVVFDLGGYRGDFAAQVVERFGCRVFLFEPVRQFHAACERRFAGDARVTCFNFGLMAAAGEFRISLEENGSSIVKESGEAPGETVRVEAFADVVQEHGIAQIDLLKVNIEGGEYDVLRHLVDTGLIDRVRHLQVQFHDFIPDAVRMRDTLRADLARTHRESWNYPFVWESWERR